MELEETVGSPDEAMLFVDERSRAGLRILGGSTPTSSRLANCC